MALTVYVPQRQVVADRRYGHPINVPVIAMALAAWALVALIIIAAVAVL